MHIRKLLRWTSTCNRLEGSRDWDKKKERPPFVGAFERSVLDSRFLLFPLQGVGAKQALLDA